MTRTKRRPVNERPVYLTGKAITRLENGHTVSFQVGDARGTVGRNPADGRYLWAIRWGRMAPTYNAKTDTWTNGEPESYAQGTADSLGAALDAIDAHRRDRVK
jgi:hypothetical protein